MKNVVLIVFVLLAVLAGYIALFEPDIVERFLPKDRQEQTDKPAPPTATPPKRQPKERAPAEARIQVDAPPEAWFFNGKPLPLENEVTIPAEPGTLTGFTRDGYVHVPLDIASGEKQKIQITEVRQRPAQTWQTFQADGHRRGYVDAPSLDELTVRWQTSVGGRVSASPIVVADVAYVTTDKRAAVALDLAQGKVLWQADQTGSDVAPVTNGQFLFTGNDQGQFAGFRMDDGKQKGFTSLGSYPIALAPASDDMFLAVTRDNQVYGIATKKGFFGKLPLKIEWETSLPMLAGSNAAPLIVDDRAIFQTQSGLAALDLSSGRVLWPETAGEAAADDMAQMQLAVVDESQFRTPTPAAGNGVVYAIQNGALTAFHQSSGDAVWQEKLRVKVTSSLSLANGLVYAGFADGSVRAFSAANGRQVFRSDVSEQAIFASPVLFADRMLVATRSGDVLLLHAMSGEVIARDNTLAGAPILATPAVTKDAILVINQNGKAVGYR